MNGAEASPTVRPRAARNDLHRPETALRAGRDRTPGPRGPETCRASPPLGPSTSRSAVSRSAVGWSKIRSRRPRLSGSVHRRPEPRIRTRPLRGSCLSPRLRSVRSEAPRCSGSVAAIAVRGPREERRRLVSWSFMAERKRERILVAPAWPYAAGLRHLGHVTGFAVPADIFARYHRLRGNDVLMVSGTDEHGTPVMVAADNEGVSPREIADRYNEAIREDLRALGTSYAVFCLKKNVWRAATSNRAAKTAREKADLSLRL